MLPWAKTAGGGTSELFLLERRDRNAEIDARSSPDSPEPSL